MLPPTSSSVSSTNSSSNTISMAWLDRFHNDSPFYESFDGDKHEASQLLVLVFRAYFSPIIFVHGVCGNLLSLVVLCRLHRRTPGRFNLYAIAITVLFLVLLVFDTFLDDFFGRGLGWLTQYRFNLKMDQISSLSCKCITYVTDSSGFTATTILAIFGLDRVRTVYSPFQFRGDRHLRCTTILIVAIVVIGLALFSPTFVFYDIVVSNVTNQTSCTLTNPSLPGATYTLLIYVLGSYTLPTVVIIICNLLIAWQLVAIKRNHRKCGISVSSRRDIRRIIGHLGINTAFLLLMIPLVVVILMRYDSSLFPSRHSEAYRQRLIHLSRFFSSLLSVYFSSSFWVFFLFLPTFRDAVLELLLACPLIASSVCGPYLYRRMTYGGARRFCAKSMTPSLMCLSPLPPLALGAEKQGFQTRGSLPSPGLAVLLARPMRSISTPSIVHLKT
uniref:G protein coupled receptor n=2 Tax=Echinococcus granulosus TaxID=6210 RepID=A0A068WJQ3_ECHGR|nr:G protein coupled receptor fragment [Echinococcus granulosus]